MSDPSPRPPERSPSSSADPPQVSGAADRNWRALLGGVVIGVVGTLLVVLLVAVARDDDSSLTDVAVDEGESTTSSSTRSTSTTSGSSTTVDALPTTSTTTAPLADGEGSKTAGGSPPALVPGSGGSASSSSSSEACSAVTRRVSTADELQDALDAADPGDTILLADGVYTGSFVATRSGARDAPITLCGTAAAVLDGDGISKGYVFHLNGVQHWRLFGFTVRNGQKGVMADATSDSVIQGLTVEQIGDEAIHLRSGSSNNAVLDNTIRRTGLRRAKFGEGIYIGSAISNWEQHSGGGPDRSDNNLVQGNTISETTAEAIDIKEGTTGGRVIGNVMDGSGTTDADSLIDVKGNDWLIEGNTGRNAPEEGFQTHRIIDGWGAGNVFRRNVVDVVGNGRHIYIHDPEITNNRVHCDNTTAAGGPIRSNVTCVP